MIVRSTVKGFKSIRQETELEIAPLTVFAGANSSGKSTLLQAILLIAQTLSDDTTSTSILLNGRYARLGEFRDVLSGGSDDGRISIDLTCVPVRAANQSYGLEVAQCGVSFDAASSGHAGRPPSIYPSVARTWMWTRLMEDDGDGLEMSVTRVSPEETERARQASPTSEHSVDHGYSVAFEMHPAAIIPDHPSILLRGCTWRHFIPEKLLASWDSREDLRILLDSWFRDIDDDTRHAGNTYCPWCFVGNLKSLAESVGDRALVRLLSEPQFPEFGPDYALPPYISHVHDCLVRGRRSRARKQVLAALDAQLDNFITEAIESVVYDDSDSCGLSGLALGVHELRLPYPLDAAATYFSESVASVRYLGPLREEPRSLHAQSPTAEHTDVGVRGENTAAVLNANHRRRVEYIAPAGFLTKSAAPSRISRTLTTAVVDWLRYLGMADGIRTRDRGRLGFELRVTQDDTVSALDLTHVGVGVSQVLPILVSCLLAPPDTTLVIEQPELHLHPRVQSRLADFFLSMTQLDKQCIIETHSEHIINRIRYRIAAAEGPVNPWLNATRVYFVTKKEGNSEFREVAINEYGAVLDWPEGFFDETQSEAEAILAAASAKRRTARLSP